MPCKRTVHRIANRFQMTGSMLDIYIYIKLCWLLEGMVSKSSADKAWNVLKVCPCNIRALQQFFPLDQEVRSWYPMDFLIQIGVFSDEYWFILNRTVNNLSNRYWYSENLYAVNVPLYNFKVGVWYTMSAHKITGHLFFKDTVNSEHYMWLILTPFFRDLQPLDLQIWISAITVCGDHWKTELIQTVFAGIQRETANIWRWALSCGEKYFQKVWGMAGSCTWAFHDSSVKHGKLNSRKKNGL